MTQFSLEARKFPAPIQEVVATYKCTVVGG